MRIEKQEVEYMIWIICDANFIQYMYMISVFPDMPKSYMFRMVSMKFADQKAEKPLPEDETITQKLSKNDLSRIKNSHSSFK